ncbi:hypothetical protein FOL46_000185, partial [Perkinsus olseni]
MCASVNFLGFTKLTTSKRILLKNVDLSIAEAAREMYDELLVDDEVLRTSCPKTLTDAVSTLRQRAAGDSADEDSPRRGSSPRREIRRAYSDIRLGHRVITPDTRMMPHSDTRARLEQLAIQETVVSIRKTLLSAVKAEYWDFMDLGLLPRNSTAAQLLIYSVDTAQQFHIEKRMNDWNKLRKRLESGRRMSLWRLKQKTRLSTDFASSWAELTVYVVDSFVAAHVRAQKSIARYYGHTESADTAEEWLVIEESKHQVREAKEFLRKILGKSGERVVRLAHSKQLAQFILIHQKTIVETMGGQGVVSEGDAENFLHKIQSDLESLATLKLSSIDPTCLKDPLEDANSRTSEGSEEGSALAEESEDAFESFPTNDRDGGEGDNFLLTVIKSARICMLAHGEDLVDELEFLAKKILESPVYSHSWMISGAPASPRGPPSRVSSGAASPVDLTQPLLPEIPRAPSTESMPGTAIRTIARRVSTRMQAHRQLMRGTFPPPSEPHASSCADSVRRLSILSSLNTPNQEGAELETDTTPDLGAEGPKTARPQKIGFFRKIMNIILRRGDGAQKRKHEETENVGEVKRFAGTPAPKKRRVSSEAPTTAATTRAPDWMDTTAVSTSVEEMQDEQDSARQSEDGEAAESVDERGKGGLWSDDEEGIPEQAAGGVEEMQVEQDEGGEAHEKAHAEVEESEGSVEEEQDSRLEQDSPATRSEQ